MSQISISESLYYTVVDEIKCFNSEDADSLCGFPQKF